MELKSLISVLCFDDGICVLSGEEIVSEKLIKIV